MIPGNHDLYNSGARCYLPSDEELAYLTEDEQTALIRSYGSRMALPVNLVDFYEIYHGLGYGEETLGTLDYFYKSSYFYGCGNADYNRALAPNDPTADEIESQKSDPTVFDKATRAGGLSYIARMADGFTLVAIDSNRLSYTSPFTYSPIGDDAYRFGRWTCQTAGDISHEQLLWIENVLTESEKPTALVGASHHSVVPHTDMEDEITTRFMASDFRTACYYLADLGVRYVFTGHVHANDVATYVSQKGNVLYDLETPSTAVYGAAIRVVRLDVMQSGAEKAFDNLYAIESLNGKDTEDLIAHLNGRISSILSLIPDYYLNEDLIVKLKNKANDLSGKTIAGTFTVGQVTVDLLKDLIDDAFTLDLVKPTIENGTYAFPKETTAGYHALDLAADLVDYLFSLDCSLGKVPGGYTLSALAKDLYRRNLVGAEYASLTPELTAVCEALDSGELTEKLLSTVYDFLMPQLCVLFDAPISLDTPLESGKGFDLSSYAARYEAASGTEIGKAAFNLLKNNSVTSIRTLAIALKKISQNAIISAILSGIDASAVTKVLSYVNKITPKTDLTTFLNQEFVEKYVTPSLYRDLGAYAKRIALSYALDPSPDGTTIEKDGDVLRYAYPTDSLLTLRLSNGSVAYGGAYSFRGALGIEDNPPTQEDGRLPEMISLSYGEDPYRLINVKWFTRIQTPIDQFEASESYVQYYGETKPGALFLAGGEKVTLTLPLIDLGFFYLTSTKVEYEMHTASLYIGDFADGETISFRVGSDETGWSDVYTFKKKAANGKTTVLAAADLQGSVEEDYARCADSAAIALSVTPNADLFISAGDNVQKGDNVSQWSWLMRRNAALFSHYVTVTAAGEAETSGAIDYLAPLGGATATYKNEEKNGYYASFDLENAHFVILNTNDLAPNGTLSAAQTEWLTNDLDAADGKWKIVVMHKGIHSAGIHASDDDVSALRASLTGLFASHGVSLVLEGHDHAYSVSEFIAADGSAAKVSYDEIGNAVAPNGVLYLSLGSLGDLFYRYSYGENPLLQDRSNEGHLLSSLGEYLTDDMRLELVGAPSFASLEITTEKLSILTYAIKDAAAVLIDSLSIVQTPESLAAPSFSFKLEHDLVVENFSSVKLKNARVVSFYTTDENGTTRYLKGYSVGENVQSRYVLKDGKAYLASACFVATAEASDPSGVYAPLPRAEFIALVPYQGTTAMRVWAFALILSLSGAALLGGATAVFLILKKKRARNAQSRDTAAAPEPEKKEIEQAIGESETTDSSGEEAKADEPNEQKEIKNEEQEG